MKEIIKAAAIHIAQIGSRMYLDEPYRKNPPKEVLDVLIEINLIALRLFKLAEKMP